MFSDDKVCDIQQIKTGVEYEGNMHSNANYRKDWYNNNKKRSCGISRQCNLLLYFTTTLNGVWDKKKLEIWFQCYSWEFFSFIFYFYGLSSATRTVNIRIKWMHIHTCSLRKPSWYFPWSSTVSGVWLVLI